VSIDLASYGTPLHTDAVDCAEWAIDPSCSAANSTAIVEAACLHQQRCSFPADNALFGEPCGGISKTLAIRATCSGGQRSVRAARAIVSESGQVMWDGTKVVGKAQGVIAIRELADGVAFDVQSGRYSFDTQAIVQ
jgi:hypothetical protein